MIAVMRRTSMLLGGTLLLVACSTGDGDESAVSDTTLAPAPAPEPDDPDDPGDQVDPEDEPVDDDPVDDEGGDDAEPASEMPPATDVGEIRPGVEQVALTGATPGSIVHLLPDDVGAVGDFIDQASTGESEPPGGRDVDENGTVLFRELSPGDAYRFVLDGEQVSEPFTPLGRSDHPNAPFFAEQLLPAPGYGYIETRDGTTLSANVSLPGPAEDGPYPTVVEYSGYTPSDPEATGFGDLFTSLGYAYVGVNMRGTGCSGGSFRFFEYTQSTDGYDVIETVAAQPWVLNNRVGMVGVSYPGISQLFVAQTQPPSLAAITPLSVLDDSYRSTLYPGGILNTGFAVEWTQDRMDDGRPAPDGQQWAADRIDAGDEVCEQNQELRLQNPDLVQEIRDNPFYTEELGDPLAPRQFADRITVPTFVAGAWQDEQTGGRFPTMLDRFTGTDRLYASLTNGLHTDSISPAVFPRFFEFLELYVAERTPSLALAGALAPILASGLFGTGDSLPFEDRFAGLSHEEALAAFEAEPPIHVLFENGAAEGLEPLTPGARFVETFDAWPVPDVELRRFFLGAGGELLADVEPDGGAVDYAAVPPDPQTFWEGNSSDLWRTDVAWNWTAPPAEEAAVFTSAPLDESLTMVGSGSVDLRIRVSADDTDIETTLIEVLPDGSEVYVQSGWLRASQRALDDATSTALRPVHTHTRSDARPLDPSADFEQVRVELFPFAHVFRAGSQIRLTIDAPGGNRAVWEFETIADGELVTIGTGDPSPSLLKLPVVPGIEPPAEAPACGSLRGQPCRPG